MKVTIKPASGFSHIFHILLQVLLPLLLFVFVRLRFFELATLLVLLAKWRMLAVKLRHWPASIRANAVDLIVGLGLLVFMINSGSQLMQMVWAIAYALWLVFIKPRSEQWGIALQALIAQLVGLSALFLQYGDAPLYVLVLLTWSVCYASARHFFASFDEPLNSFLASLWGYIAATIVWLLGHWLLFYGVLSQPTLLLTIISTTLASVYYLDKTDRLSAPLRRQLLFLMIGVVAIIIVFSYRGDRTI